MTRILLGSRRNRRRTVFALRPSRADVLIEADTIASVRVFDTVPAIASRDRPSARQRGLSGVHRRACPRRGTAAGSRAGQRCARPGSHDPDRWPGRGIVDRRHRGDRAVSEPLLRPSNETLEPLRSLTVSEYREAVSGRLTQNVAVLTSPGADPAQPRRPGPRAAGPGERAAARSSRLRTRWRTVRSGCPAGWITCPAGSAALRRLVT